MRRNVVFGRGRGWQVEDDRYRELHLGPQRGAAVGEYASQETSEFSDSYYAPGDDYPHDEVARVGGITRSVPPARSGNRLYGEVYSYGELRPGQPSWADLRGRGPKGYRRTDERLREAICERLTDDEHIDASEISVEVQGGKVTLTGSVDRKQTKWNVEDLVESVSGVSEIDNRLRARHPVR